MKSLWILSGLELLQQKLAKQNGRTWMCKTVMGPRSALCTMPCALWAIGHLFISISLLKSDINNYFLFVFCRQFNLHQLIFIDELHTNKNSRGGTRAPELLKEALCSELRAVFPYVQPLLLFSQNILALFSLLRERMILILSPDPRDKQQYYNTHKKREMGKGGETTFKRSSPPQHIRQSERGGEKARRGRRIQSEEVVETWMVASSCEKRHGKTRRWKNWNGREGTRQMLDANWVSSRLWKCREKWRKDCFLSQRRRVCWRPTNTTLSRKKVFLAVRGKIQKCKENPQKEGSLMY